MIGQRHRHFHQPPTVWLIDQQAKKEETEQLCQAFEIMLATVGGEIFQTAYTQEKNRRYLAVEVLWPSPQSRRNFLWMFGNSTNFREEQKNIEPAEEDQEDE